MNTGTLTPEADALEAVFHQVQRAIADSDLASEILEDYRADYDHDAKHGATAGRFNLQRFRGYLQGLYASGVLPGAVYDQVNAHLVKAFNL